MKTIRKIFLKVKKVGVLTILWITRILFAPSHFKVNIFKRIHYAIFGGFMPDQVALYKLNRKNKHDYLSEFDWYKSRYINGEYNFILNNKLVCTDLLKEYIKVADTVFIKKDGIMRTETGSSCTTKDIIEKLKKYKKLYIKPISVGKGKGVYLLKYDKKLYIDEDAVTEKQFSEFLNARDNWFLSTCVEQSKVLNKIYDKTSNTIRLITVRNPKTNEVEVLYAVQRIGTKETIPVDNGSRGGLVANINIETGELSSAKSIQRECNYEFHPDSNNPIKGVVIPNWKEIKETFIKLMEKFPYLYFVAWDVLVTDDGPAVIEANTSSGVNIIQLWGGQRHDKLGNFYRAHNIIK